MVLAVLSEIDAPRIQQLRIARGLTQKELADTLNLPQAAMSRMLSGHSAPSAELLGPLATMLGCDEKLLGRPVTEHLYTRPWLRAYADAPKKTVDQIVNDTLLAVEAFEALNLRRIPERVPTFAGDPLDDDAIDEFAADVRAAAEVNAPHVPNVTRAAERLGCIVLPMAGELGKHLGMSMYVDGTPVVRVARPAAHLPGDRQRFTTAHELGHLSMHAASPPPDTAAEAKDIERQAHRFASAFLLPAEPFLGDLEAMGGRVTLTTLSKLKAKWGVAIKAMVVRLRQLHRIDADQARSLYKQISARGWNKNEPVEVVSEEAVWLSQAMARRFPDQDPPARAAEQTGLRRTFFDDWVDWSPATEATVITFPGR